MSYLELRTWEPVWHDKFQLPCSQQLRLHGLTSSDLGLHVNQLSLVLVYMSKERNIRRLTSDFCDFGLLWSSKASTAIFCWTFSPFREIPLRRLENHKQAGKLTRQGVLVWKCQMQPNASMQTNHHRKSIHINVWLCGLGVQALCGNSAPLDLIVNLYIGVVYGKLVKNGRYLKRLYCNEIELYTHNNTFISISIIVFYTPIMQTSHRFGMHHLSQTAVQSDFLCHQHNDKFELRYIVPICGLHTSTVQKRRRRDWVLTWTEGHFSSSNIWSQYQKEGLGSPFY